MQFNFYLNFQIANKIENNFFYFIYSFIFILIDYKSGTFWVLKELSR